jgi:hypothetical protein
VGVDDGFGDGVGEVDGVGDADWLAALLGVTWGDRAAADGDPVDGDASASLDATAGEGEGAGKAATNVIPPPHEPRVRMITAIELATNSPRRRDS